MEARAFVLDGLVSKLVMAAKQPSSPWMISLSNIVTNIIIDPFKDIKQDYRSFIVITPGGVKSLSNLLYF